MSSPYPYPADRFTLVGSVTRSHGLKGDFKVSPRGPVTGPETFMNFSRAALAAADGRMTETLDIERCRVQGRQVILKLDTIDSKTEADLLVAMDVLVPCDDHVSADTDTLLPGTSIGTPVVTAAGSPVGEIVDIVDTGAHPLLIISDGADEYLVPLVADIVIDTTDARIVIDPPDGLLDINRDEKEA